jgi:hypothetical protein
MWYACGDKKCTQNSGLETSMEENLEDLGVDEKIILEWMLENRV